MKRIIFSLFLFFLISNSVFSQCGTCTTPDCNNMIRKTGATADVTLKSALNYTSAMAAPTEAYLLDPTGDPLLGKNGPFTFSACYEIYVTSASQTVGIAVKPIFTTPGPNLSFTGELRKSGDCAASPIGVNNTIPSVSSGGQSIPSISEWTGLSIGTYVYCITTNVPIGINLKSVLVGSYVKGGVTSNECSSCAVADCKIAGPYPSFTDAKVPTDHCSKKVDISSSPVEAPTAYISYYKVKTSSSATTLGIIVSNRVGTLPGSSSACGTPTRTATLYPIAGCASGGIAGSTTSNPSSLFNREWSGLTPNTEYIIKVETTATTDCQIEDQCASYYTPGAVTPLPCGTVEFTGYLATSSSTPLPSSFSSCQDVNYLLKAAPKSTAGQYIAPGFDIKAKGSSYVISKVEVKAGTTAYQTAFSGSGLFSIFNVTYCSPSYEHTVRITATATGSGDVIEIIDHATGAIIKSQAITTGLPFEIVIPAGSIKGSSVFSGPSPGVGNYRINYPASGLTDYLGSGYATFNPKLAGNGSHKLKYTWDNGSGVCGFEEITVNVLGCATPPCPTDKTFTKVDWNTALPSNGGNNPFTPFPTNPSFTCSDGVQKIWKFFNDDKVIVENGPTGEFPGIQLRIKKYSSTKTSVKIKLDGVDYSYYGPGPAPSGVYDWGPLTSSNPLDPYDILEYYLPKGKVVEFTICDSRSGLQSIDYDLYDFSTGTSVLSGVASVNTGNCKTFTYTLSSPIMTWKLDGVATKITDNNDGTASFDVSKLSPGNHTIDYTFDNGKGCTIISNQQTFSVTGGPTGTATIGDICQGSTTALLTIPSSSLTGSPISYSIVWDATAKSAGLTNVIDRAITNTSLTLPKTIAVNTYNGKFAVKNSAGCTSDSVTISIKVMPNPTISPTTAEICVDASISLAGSGGSGTPNATTPWILKNSNVSTSLIGSVRSFKGLSAGDCDVVYMDNKGCTDTITIKVNGKPTISPTTAEICVDASISLTVSGGSGTPNATTPWILKNSNVSTSLIGSVRSFKGLSAGDCDVVYMDNKGCTDTVTIKVNGNPTITIPTTIPIPAAFILEGKDSIFSVTGGSGIGGATAWKSSSPANATVVGLGVANQTAKVSGILLGNTDIIYTDSKGCDDTVNIAISIPGCNAITKITSDQTWCQGIDPNALEFSTNETATDGISFVVFPATLRPITGADVYAGGVGIKKETPTLGKVSLDLPTLGSIVTGSLPVVIPGDYYVYGILNPPPSNTACRPFAEIKVTIKDTTSPLITIANTGTLNEYRVTWKDVPDAVSYKVDTVTYVKGNVPTTPNWKSLLPNITANHTLQAPLIFPNIPFGRTLLVQVTPLDVNGDKLSCNSIREKRIDNPSCTKPIIEPLNIPDTVCAGVSLDLLKGKINASSVKVNFEWYVSTDSLNWTLISSGGDCLISNTTVNEATDLAIKTKLTMNKSFVRLFGKDVATGQCSDTTLPVKIMVNEIPDATISIFPDPAKLCVGDLKSIEVTFQGSKGLQPYRFDFELDAIAKDTASSNIPGDGKVIKTFKTTSPILDSTFVLKKVTDKNGCFADISNQSVKMEVVALPQPIFQADKTIGCYPLEVIFTDKSAVLNTDVEWDFGNGDLDNTSLGVVKYVFQKSGDYTIKFKSTINGCWDTMQKTNYIHVKDRPVAQFSPKKTNISLIDPEIQFINSSSSNSVYYKWIFGDGSPVSNLVNPKHKYIGEGNNGLPEPGKYLVELYAFINQDCWDSTSTIITIDDEQIFYIPNTFTPNNDERNNTFQPIFTSGFDAQNYHFLIYNRWGELMFESNNSQIGWDGTYGNKLLMNDTYTWKLQFKEKMTEKEHYLTGHVNLIR